MPQSQFLSLALATLSFFCFLPVGVAQEADKQGLVLVQRMVDTKYSYDSPLFSSILNSTLTQPYLVKPNDTLQTIVSKKFRLGPSATPELYAKMVTRIQSLNDISDSNYIREGSQLSLPDIPPFQWKSPQPGNPNYGIPRMQVGPAYSDILSDQVSSKSKFDDLWNISDEGRLAEPLVNQWRWLTVEQAKAEAALALGTVDAGFSSHWSQPLTLKFGQAPVVVESKSSVASDLQFLSTLIGRRKPQRDVIVFVLDDSWPSNAAFDSSRKFVLEALAAIRSATHIPVGFPKELSEMGKTTSFPKEIPQASLHSARIESSLTDFTRLTPRVKVVYLPLFTEQDWAKELWQELTYTVLAATAMHTKLGVMRPGPSIVARSRSDAVLLVGQIPSTVVNSLGPAQQTPITVLQKFAHLYATTTGIPYFISMSWTVEKRELEFGPDPDALGVSLAAAGNDKKEVVGDAVYLAYRAKAAPGDVLAVMNTNSSGTELCGSSKLPLIGPNHFYGLAYDGTFDNGRECGTSFSTPRVAWLLALRQAYEEPVAQKSWPDWYATFRTSIVGLQNATHTTSRRYWLPIDALFKDL